MASSRPNIIIIGAGPGGLTLAVALKKAGIKACVYERAPVGLDRGSGLTLWPNALRALDSVGLGTVIRNLSAPLDGIAMFVSRGDELFRLEGSTMQGRFGDSGLALHRSELTRALLNQLGDESVRWGCTCVGLKQNGSGVTAQFADGSEAHGTVLVGADGLRSEIRSHLFGSHPLRYSGYTVWRGVASMRLRQRVGLTSLGCGSQFGLFPMARDRVYWFASTNAPEGEQDAPDHRKQAVLERFGAWHAPVREVIENTCESAIIRKDIYDMAPLPSWSHQYATLLGDAAHPSTPDLGQGACQAIEDAVVLARALAETRETENALTLYEQRRLRRTRAISLQARRIGQAGTWTNPLACWFRNQAIRHIPAPLRLRQLEWMFDFKA